MLITGIVILNYNTPETTIDLIKRVQQYDSIQHIVVVDNASTDNSVLKIEEYLWQNNKKTDFIRSSQNTGYAKGNNQGLKWLKNHYNVDILFVANPDVYFQENLILEIIKTYEQELDYGILTAIRKDENDAFTIRQFWRMPDYKSELLHSIYIGQKLIKRKDIKVINTDKRVMQIDVSPGAFFSIRADLLERIGYLDEGTFLYYEESCLAAKVKLSGYKIGICTKVYYNSYINRSSINRNDNTDFIAKAQMQSRKYFLNKYIKPNLLKKYFFCLVEKYSMFELKGILLLKRLIR